MTAIDNDGDGIVEYVLYLQETLTQVIAKSDSKETTTLNAFNKNKAIDNENIVTDATCLRAIWFWLPLTAASTMSPPPTL